jgi:Skp family chaperone for outer membrane proteins
MKNIIIVVLVGLSFLTSGFWIGLRLAPMPKKPAPVAVAHAAPKPVDPKVAFSVDSLKRASENMQSINDALQAREQAVAAREKAAAQKEDELAAERAALDRLHAQFKKLYGEFQQRLQLVTDTETGALERQVTVFNAMDPAQAIDLVRSLDDPTVTRLFALMEDKPLAKIISAWKQKYPADTARLLGDLNGIGRVVAKDKIDLPDMAPAADTSTPAAPPTSTDISTPPSAPADTTTDNATPPAASTDAAAPAPAPDGSISGHEPYANAGTPPPDLGTPDAPATPPAPAAIPDASAPAASPSDQDQTTPPPAAPSDSNNAAPAPQAAPAGTSTSASTDSPLLDSPGETAARASGSVPHDDADTTPLPSEFKPPTPTMRLAHDKPTRLARNN